MTLPGNDSVTFVFSYFLITRLMPISPGFVCLTEVGVFVSSLCEFADADQGKRKRNGCLARSDCGYCSLSICKCMPYIISQS